MGSVLIWFWLAKIIKGSSQQVSTSRGVDRGSVPKYELEEAQPVSKGHLIQVRLVRAIVRLWKVIMVQSHFGGDSQIVGNSMIVGIRIFSIVVSLGLVGGLFREFGLWQLVRLVLLQLHRLRRLVGE